MRFELDRLPSDPVLLQRMLREMAEVLEQERAALNAAKAVVTTQDLTIEKLEHRLARLLRVQFGRSSEKMDIAQLRLMFDEIDTPVAANDDTGSLGEVRQPAPRKAGVRAPIPTHVPRQVVEHRPGTCSPGCTGQQTQIGEDVTEVLDYPLNRWAAMVRYCDDGLLEISNNLVENALRGVALGRRNWMFVGSIKGGQASALFYSLVETCKLNGVEPETWLPDVIERIGNHPINRIDELLPWRWQAARDSALAA